MDRVIAAVLHGSLAWSGGSPGERLPHETRGERCQAISGGDRACRCRDWTRFERRHHDNEHAEHLEPQMLDTTDPYAHERSTGVRCGIRPRGRLGQARRRQATARRSAIRL